MTNDNPELGPNLADRIRGVIQSGQLDETIAKIFGPPLPEATKVLKELEEKRRRAARVIADLPMF